MPALHQQAFWPHPAPLFSCFFCPCDPWLVCKIEPTMGHAPRLLCEVRSKRSVPRAPGTVQGQHVAPPPAASRFIVRDRGSAGPRYLRSSINQVRAWACHGCTACVSSECCGGWILLNAVGNGSF